MVGYSSQQESGIDIRQQSAIMQVTEDGRAGRRCAMAVCLINLESDSSVLDLFSMSFWNNVVAMVIRDTVECLQWQDSYHHDGHHQRTDGAPHTPSPVLMHVHMQLNPKRGRCEFRPTFRGYTGTLGGVITHKREDGVSVDSNEVARHAHGKRFTGARPESELVASLTIEYYEEEPAGNWARFTTGGRLAADRFRSPGFARFIAEGTASMCRCRQVTSVSLSSGRGPTPDACALKPETGSVNGLRPADETGFFRAGTLSTAGAHPDVMRLQAVR